MTVAELLAELQKLPPELPVNIVYDSAVCREDIVKVARWFPQAYMRDDSKDRGPEEVGLFDDSSLYDVGSVDRADKRFWPRPEGE